MSFFMSRHPWPGQMKAGHGGFACASCTDFLGLFLLACRLASARVLVMWDGYVERPWDLDSDRLLYLYKYGTVCVASAVCVGERGRTKTTVRRFMVKAACNMT